jgi:hypothetical protein
MSFFSRLKAALASMWKHAPAVTIAVASAVNNIVPLVELLDPLILGQYAAILNPILDKIKVGLSALKTTAVDAGLGNGEKANLDQIVLSIQTNLSSLVAAAQIKDPALALRIQAIAAVVATAVTGIHDGLSQPATTAPANTAAGTTAAAAV